MSPPLDGWKNKRGTEDRSCQCGSWKNHWLNFSGKSWPDKCAVGSCSNKATLGAHVYNSSVSGEYIVPMCRSCNAQQGEFSLKGNTTLVSANKSKTCEA